MPRSRPSNGELPLLAKEMNYELSDDRRFREQPLSVVQRFRGRSNRRMSLRSLDGQLRLPVRDTFQIYHMLSANELSSALPLCIAWRFARNWSGLPSVFRQ